MCIPIYSIYLLLPDFNNNTVYFAIQPAPISVATCWLYIYVFFQFVKFKLFK